ncbi:immunoglobulin kappa light chain-like [Micropterus salmoides]|uniref:immunoglobulin kappa light chain-like n=1 Tax=Micropterus salmoides TaxID=27706 RepID=UPI0018EBB581|nr:immunoglobulin kappa light chain-like [Micropterus salmoides]
MDLLYTHQDILITMTSLKFASYLTCLCLWRLAKLTMSLHQESEFVSANVGDNVTLKCYYDGEKISTMFYWYKQTLGQKPRLMSTFFKHGTTGTFADEFKNNSRFKLDTKKGNNHLTISDLRISDTATYYCISCYTYTFEFAEGTTVSVKGSGLTVPASVHQSASEPIQPGGSVTLNCTVHTGTCDGEHSVYWFKNSEESHPGLIYTHGGRNDQCKTKPDTHTCVYNLPMKSLNLSHTETYYCAVAACGHMLFGNRTKLDLADEVNSPVYFLSGALVFNTTLVVLLAFSVYKMNKRNICQCTESQIVPSPTTTNAQGYQDADNLHYAAVRHHRANRSRKDRRKENDNPMSQCVYSSVRQ